MRVSPLPLRLALLAQGSVEMTLLSNPSLCLPSLCDADDREHAAGVAVLVTMREVAAPAVGETRASGALADDGDL